MKRMLWLVIPAALAVAGFGFHLAGDGSAAGPEPAGRQASASAPTSMSAVPKSAPETPGTTAATTSAASASPSSKGLGRPSDIQPIPLAPASPAPSGADSTGGPKPAASAGKSFLDSPAYQKTRERMEAQKLTDLLVLFQDWKLDAAKAEQVKAIIKKRDQREREYSDKLLRHGPVSPEAQDASKAMRDAKQEASVELEAVLGPERKSELDLWEDSSQDRRRLDGYDKKLPDPNLTLNPTQRQAVLDALYRARQNGVGGNVSVYTLGDIYVREVERLAQPSLSPEQLQHLLKTLREETRRIQPRSKQPAPQPQQRQAK